MSATSEEPTIHELLSRLAELEQAHARLQEELTNVRTERAPAAEEQASAQARTHPRRSSRRKVLEKGLGVAVATVGAGALLELSGGMALAASTPKPGVFASSVAGTPAVKATGTNGADGVDATSDSGTGGTGGSGVSGTGGSAALFIGGIGGIGVHGIAGLGGTGGTPGLAGLFDGAVTVNGNVQVNGTFTATGTKSFVQAHPTDPSREIVYVALEGGEAGTYVRGTGQLVNGKAVLALPEHFGLVTATEGLTIQLTSRGEWLQLYLVELDTAQIVVREAQGKSGAFDYLIHGVRRGYEQHEVIRTKR